LLLFLLSSISVSNAVSIGVKTGDKVAYDVTTQGDLEQLGGLGPLGISKAIEGEVTGVSGNVVTITVTFTFQNDTKRTFPGSITDLGDNSFDFWIIPSGLNSGDLIVSGDVTLGVNETRTETWLGVQRTVCYTARLMGGGGMTFNITGHYDRETGIAFSLFVGLLSDGAVQASFVMTIKSASMISPPSQPPSASGIPGFPIESILLGIAISIAALTILRSRRTSPKIAV